MTTAAEQNDIALRNEGSIWLASPVSDAGRVYLAEHYGLGDDLAPYQYFAGALVIEARYVKGFVDLAREDGLNVY
jgi:hypothetical protein